ncbi:TetR/AcrR family transcriptional regulator [Filimonas effusa]|uniref:TetR/AcrR family transcriptional regulator n=1 Tax=Filimonas effusa TaxID=2508721 RepID=A0A4Q1D9G6_9BACT|nr:TetR/AcrR family transcriptional regulator [Filimonas effusa]RXK86027.1 TetR/AcrR family transcriptional regulator [Filimonas effusa]
MKDSETRTRILQTAKRLFYEQGYNNTGINQVIDEAGIARASLYHHFSSKRDLLTAYLEEMSEQFVKELNVHLSPLKEPRKRLLGFFDYWIEKQYNTSFGGCHVVKISAEAIKADQVLFQQAATHKENLKQFIATQVNLLPARESQSLTKELLTETLFLLLEGAIVNATIQRNNEPLKQARKIAARLI